MIQNVDETDLKKGNMEAGTLYTKAPEGRIYKIGLRQPGDKTLRVVRALLERHANFAKRL